MVDNKKLAELLFPDIKKTPEDIEKMYPPRELKEGARVTRFAPSPTGYLHIGGLFGALVDVLTAKASGGISYLRIEDTDKKREIDDGVSAIINGFKAFGIEFDEPKLGEYRFVRYSFSFAWYNDHGTGAKITDETIEIRSTESVKYTAYLKRAEGKYRASKATSAYRKLELSDDTLAIDAISMIKDVEIADAVRQIKEINYRVCDSLELDDSFRPNPIEIEVGENVSFGNEDIPRMLAMLKEKKEDLYNLFVETIYDLFPEFNNIELQILTTKENNAQEEMNQAIVFSQAEGGNTEIKIPYHIRNELFRLVINSKYLNQPISMELMSTGTKRIFWLIANAVVADYRGINLLGVDEIETSIHPKMIRSLLEALSEILENTSLIITSHSPYLIQYLKPEYRSLLNNMG